MKQLIALLCLFLLLSCNTLWNLAIDGPDRKVFKNDDRKTIVITYPVDSVSKIKIK